MATISKIEKLSNGVDKRSSLPDNILGEILSLLPIKNATTTSIPAQRWKHLWSLHRHAVFCCPSGVGLPRLCEAVDHVLRHLSPQIETFSIEFPYVTIRNANRLNLCLAYLSRWIPEVCGRNVTRLIISISRNIYNPVYTVSSCVFGAKTFQHLELRGNILLKTCSALERFNLEFNSIAEVLLVDICSSSLRFLQIRKYGTSSSCRINIDAPMMETFDIYDTLVSYQFVNRPTLLNFAKVIFRLPIWDSADDEILVVTKITNFISVISKVKKLELGCDLGLFFGNDFAVINSGIWLTFSNRTELVVNLRYKTPPLPQSVLSKLRMVTVSGVNREEEHQLGWVKDLLNNAPLLKELHVLPL
ncbi:F-box/LRR-repeat protein At1g55660-like [Spinacia oleracea]|uniref:F-box/LRR-repeat protein At1g55660-like n=1 Tax=Spinacia oleracea TaxID=3562 RepID=A0A9R0K6G6_SPIOL|nr:F-box/LRR-repeat protein At1g55660-like [Spinacia oleracea]